MYGCYELLILIIICFGILNAQSPKTTKTTAYKANQGNINFYLEIIMERDIIFLGKYVIFK
jgi:hypothetical protein